MERYEVVKTSSPNNHTLTYRVTSNVTGNSYTVEKGENRDWKCECKGFMDGIRKGNDAHCWHIKACSGLTRAKVPAQPSRTVPEPEDVPFYVPSCTGCGATGLTKAGKKKGKQMYRCKSCNRRYVHTEPGFQRNKYPPNIVADALSMLTTGVSYRNVAENVAYCLGAPVSHTIVLYWAKKYTALIKEYLDALRPITGNVWSIDEAVINVKKTNRLKGVGYVDWLWTAIDPKTRFVLATRITTDTRMSEDASAVIDEIKSMYRDPRYIVSDSLTAYEKPIRNKLPRTVHVRTHAIRDGFTNMAVERYHNEIRENLKARRGLGNDASAQVFCDLLRIYHNLIRPHMGLNGKTPAEAAGLITGRAAAGKYRSMISMAAASRSRSVAREIGPLNEKAEIRVGEDDIRVVPKGWLDNDDWRRLNGIMLRLGFIWMFTAYARYWIRFHNAPPAPS